MKCVLEQIAESAAKRFGVTLISTRQEAGELTVVIDDPLCVRDRCDRIATEIHGWFPNEFASGKVWNISDTVDDWSKAVKR